MKKIILTAIAVVTLASSASAWTSTTMRNIGSTTYINSYGSVHNLSIRHLLLQ